LPKRNICIVITARASYARVKSVLKTAQEHDDIELMIVAGASLVLEKYGEAANIVEKDGFKINEKVYMVLEGENLTTMVKTVGIGIIELATIFDNSKPDIVVTVADRYETIATAIAASYLNIPVAHIQGGELTGSIDEKVRHAVTKLSNIHFVANENAARRVSMMGEDSRFIYVTGCPSVDLAADVLNNPDFGFDFYSKYKGVGEYVDLEQDFIIAMQHPVTTEYTDSYGQIKETLAAITELKMPTILLWPNVDAGSDKVSKAIRQFREIENPNFVYFLKNLEPEDFLRLLIKSKGIVGNSSVGIRECSFLGVPTVNIGNRQAKRDRAENVIDVGYDRREIMSAIRTHLNNGSKYPQSFLYGTGQAGKNIVGILSEIEPSSHKSFVDNIERDHGENIDS